MVNKLNRAMQRNPLLTEAMTRAYVFAGRLGGRRGGPRGEDHRLDVRPRDGDGDPSEGPVPHRPGDLRRWLSNLLAWLTRRASATDVSKRLDLAVRLLIGDAEHPQV